MKSIWIPQEEQEQVKHERRSEEIACEMEEMKEYQYQWKKTIRDRIREGNGVAWIRYFRNHYDFEKVLNKIKRDHTREEIREILLKGSLWERTN